MICSSFQIRMSNHSTGQEFVESGLEIHHLQILIFNRQITAVKSLLQRSLLSHAVSFPESNMMDTLRELPMLSKLRDTLTEQPPFCSGILALPSDQLQMYFGERNAQYVAPST